jgi:RNA polymerase sigma factor (TIGR02999 family)
VSRGKLEVRVARSIGTPMNDVARLLEQIEKGDACAADDLVPIVYEQLRRLAHKQLAQEAPGQSFQTADLVHEAYLRLVGSDQSWRGRGHFLAAAAEAMRRILVERARKKRRIKHGGRNLRVEFGDVVSVTPSSDEVVAVSDLLDSLAKEHPLEAQIVKLHYFAGLTIREAGNALGISKSATHRHWTFARAWLRAAMQNDDEIPGNV